jgi:hypothetical protein
MQRVHVNLRASMDYECLEVFISHHNCSCLKGATLFFDIALCRNRFIYTQILAIAHATKRRAGRTRCDRTMDSIGASLAWACPTWWARCYFVVVGRSISVVLLVPHFFPSLPIRAERLRARRGMDQRRCRTQRRTGEVLLSGEVKMDYAHRVRRTAISLPVGTNRARRGSACTCSSVRTSKPNSCIFPANSCFD